MAGRGLLIEDEVNIAEAIRFLLTRDGCEVEVLADGHAAVAAVARALPDLVILDLMLPGMSGLEILSALRADPVTVAVPVLMLTAKGQGRHPPAAPPPVRSTAKGGCAMRRDCCRCWDSFC